MRNNFQQKGRDSAPDQFKNQQPNHSHAPRRTQPPFAKSALERLPRFFCPVVYMGDWNAAFADPRPALLIPENAAVLDLDTFDPAGIRLQFLHRPYICRVLSQSDNYGPTHQCHSKLCGAKRETHSQGFSSCPVFFDKAVQESPCDVHSLPLWGQPPSFSLPVS